MASRRILLALALLTAGTLLLFFLLNQQSRRLVDDRFRQLASAEAKTIDRIMAVAGNRLLRESEGALVAFLTRMMEDEPVVYVALGDAAGLRFADTKFEGFLPVAGQAPGVRIVATPLGPILEITTPLTPTAGREHRVSLGFFLEALPEIQAGSRRNFLLLTLVQVAAALLVLLAFASFQRRLARKELQIQAERAEKLRLREASLISAAINHEIKNPLHSLSLSVQLLAESCREPDEESRRHLGILRQEIGRLKAIMEQVSLMGRLPLPLKRRLPLDEFLPGLLPLLQPLAPAAELSLSSPAGAVLVSDPDLLKQVLINLVKNSGEAGAGHVWLTVEMHAGAPLLRVSDDGNGIPEPVRLRLFEPQISAKSHGAGMGLAIVRRIVWSLGGSVAAADRPGGGTEFRIALPPGEEP